MDCQASGVRLLVQNTLVTTPCQQLRKVQAAACAELGSSFIQVLPGTVIISQLASNTLTVVNVNITATDCAASNASLTGNGNAVISGASSTANTTPTGIALPALPCISVPAYNWSGVRQVLNAMQPLTAAVRVVLAANMTIDPPCSSCASSSQSTAVQSPRPAAAGSVASLGNCTCSEDGWPAKLVVYRNVTLCGDAARGYRTVLDLGFHEGAICLIASNGATLLLGNLTVTKLPPGPLNRFPLSLFYVYAWFADYTRCLTTQPAVTFMNSTLVFNASDLNYSAYWWRLAASASAGDVSSAAWLLSVDCGAIGVRRAAGYMKQLDSTGQVWLAANRQIPGLQLVNSLVTTPQWLGMDDYASPLPYTRIFMETYHPLAYAHYVSDAATLIKVLQFPKYPDIVLIANISVPAEALPSGGIDVPIEIRLHGWPGRPTVLDMQGASGVIRITNRLVLHNLWVMNTGVAPAGTYPEAWVNNTMLWSFQFDRRNSLLETRCCAIVVSATEVPGLNAALRAGVDIPWLDSAQVSSRTPTFETFQTFITLTGVVGYNTSFRTEAVAFPNLDTGVAPYFGWATGAGVGGSGGAAAAAALAPPGSPGISSGSASSSSSGSGDSGSSGRQPALGSAVGLPLGLAVGVAVVATVAVLLLLQRRRAVRSSGSSAATKAGELVAAWWQPPAGPGFRSTEVIVTVDMGSCAQPANRPEGPGCGPHAAGRSMRSSGSPQADNTALLAAMPPAPDGSRGSSSGSGGSSSSIWDLHDPDDPFNQYCGTHSLLINQAGMSRELQQQLAADSSGSLAERLNAMVARMQEELCNQEVVLERVIGQGASAVVYEGQWRGMRVACKTVTFTRTAGDRQRAARKEQAAMNEVAVCRSLQHNNIVNAFGYHLIPLAPVGGSATGSSAPSAPGTATNGSVGTGSLAASKNGSSGDLQQIDYRLVLIQEFCEGGTLRDAIDDGLLAAPAANSPVAGGEGPTATLPTGSEVNAAAVVQLATDVAAGMSHIHSRNIIHSDLSPANILLRACEYAPSRHVAKVAGRG